MQISLQFLECPLHAQEFQYRTSKKMAIELQKLTGIKISHFVQARNAYEINMCTENCMYALNPTKAPYDGQEPTSIKLSTQLKEAGRSI